MGKRNKAGHRAQEEIKEEKVESTRWQPHKEEAPKQEKEEKKSKKDKERKKRNTRKKAKRERRRAGKQSGGKRRQGT